MKKSKILPVVALPESNGERESRLESQDSSVSRPIDEAPESVKKSMQRSASTYLALESGGGQSPPPKPKRRLERNAEHQKYRVSDGSLVPGGSTTSKYGDSPEPLIIWANREGLKGNDLRTIRDRSANSGTCGHFLIECYFRGEEADLREFEPRVVTLATNSFNKFLQFWEREQLTIVDTEIQLVSETYRYGGTLDAVARDEFGNLVLLDWKSSKKDIYFSQRAQIAAYEGLWIECKEKELGQIKRRAIVRLPSSEDGTCEAHWIPDEKQERYIKIARAQAYLFNVIKANK